LGFDRGGDRWGIMEPLLQESQELLICQVGKRDLLYKGQRLPLKTMSRLVKLSQSYTGTKTKKNRKVKESYD